MDKQQFLTRLEERLRFLAEAERKDILYDYEEHINAAVENGEAEEAVVEKLGSPELIARQFNASRVIHQAERDKTTGNMLRAVMATMGVGFFNLIFVVGPFFALLGCLIGVYATAFGLALSGVITAAVGLYGLLGGNLDNFVNIGRAFSYNGEVISVGIIGLGVCLGSIGGLIGVLSAWLTKWFYRGTLGYLKLNVRLIKGEPIGISK